MTYIAMNRFKLPKDACEDFEQMWLTRENHLKEMEGFETFHLLRGPEYDDHILYSSHTVWRSKGDFEAWTKSDAFRKAHERAGERSNKRLFLGHPQFEGFEAVQTLDNRTAA